MNRGDKVVITYGHNKVLNKPFETIAEFKYYNLDHDPVCSKVGENSTQDSFALKVKNGSATIRLATEDDLKNIRYE